MEGVLASVFKLADMFFKHSCTWCLAELGSHFSTTRKHPYKHPASNCKTLVTVSSTVVARCAYNSWEIRLYLFLRNEFISTCREHSWIAIPHCCSQSFPDMRSETEPFQQIKFRDLPGGIKQSHCPVSGCMALSSSPETRDALFHLFPNTSRSQRLPRSHRLLARQRKETSSFLVHPLWEHKPATRSYRMFFLFIINIVPKAVTCRIKEVWKDFNWLR